MVVDETPCPDGPLLEKIFLGLAPPERGEELAKHVENCLRCNEEMELLRQYPPPPPTIIASRPWRAFFLYAAILIIIFAAIYSIVLQAHR